MNIPLLKPPIIPPSGFFEPISTEPSEQFSRTEFLFGVLKKLNVVITKLNELSENVDSYDERLTNVENTLTSIKDELTETLTKFKAEVEIEINTSTTLSKSYSDYLYALLKAEIDNVVAGQINVYDPTTGLLSPIQNVINNIYDSGRLDALTATEYDALELTATDYDGRELSAYAYDNQGKTLLSE